MKIVRYVTAVSSSIILTLLKREKKRTVKTEETLGSNQLTEEHSLMHLLSRGSISLANGDRLDRRPRIWPPLKAGLHRKGNKSTQKRGSRSCKQITRFFFRQVGRRAREDFAFH